MTKEEWEDTWDFILWDSMLAEELMQFDDVDAEEANKIPEMLLGDFLEEGYPSQRHCVEELGLKPKTAALIKRIWNMLYYMPTVATHALEGEWKLFMEEVYAHWETMGNAIRHFYDDMPSEYKRDFIVNCYDNHGNFMEICRVAVIDLPRNGVNELPEELRGEEQITVYRAGEEPIEEAPERISWTIRKETAEFFLKTYVHRRARYLYRAHIKPQDVIAYDDERSEKEVLQYRSVYDVELIESISE